MITLEKTYYLAQIAAVIALIVSLLYVGQQIQQNTLSISNSSLQAASDTFIYRTGLVAQDAELANILRRSEADYASLSEDEKYRAKTFASMTLAQLYNEFLTRQSGAHSARSWEILLPYFRWIMKSEVNRHFYIDNQALFDEDFRVFMDSIIQEIVAS